MRVQAHTRRGGHAGNTAHGEAQRRALTQAAYHLIAEKGFEGLRTRDVAARAGVNIATLHYYFATKEDLIRGVVGLMHDLFKGKHPSEAPCDEDAPLVAFQEDLAGLPHQWHAEPHLYIVLMELYQRALRDPTIRRIMDDLEAGWTEYLTGYLTRGVAQGVFRRDLDIPLLATMMRVLFKGMILEMMRDEDAFPVERLSTEIERWLRHNVAP